MHLQTLTTASYLASTFLAVLRAAVRVLLFGDPLNSCQEAWLDKIVRPYGGLLLAADAPAYDHERSERGFVRIRPTQTANPV